VAVVALCGAASATTVAWLWLATLAVLPRVLVAGTCLVVIGYAAVWLYTVPARATDLFWDGRRWHVAPIARSGQHAGAGSLEVTIDLGSWMLLRLDLPPDGGVRRTAVWLPVARRSVGADWHALRCAVHAVVPPGGPDDAPVAR
jgi:hypothetical protein